MKLARALQAETACMLVLMQDKQAVLGTSAGGGVVWAEVMETEAKARMRTEAVGKRIFRRVLCGWGERSGGCGG